MKRILVVIVAVVSLAAGACEVSDPWVFYEEAGLKACAISGFDHNENGTSTANADLVAGSLTAVRSGNCNGGEVIATMNSAVSMVYLYDPPDGPAHVWVCNEPHVWFTPQTGASSLLNTVGNNCPTFITTNPVSGPYPATGWYASLSTHVAFFFGTPHHSGGFPLASPWEYVDLCDLPHPLCINFPAVAAMVIHAAAGEDINPPTFEEIMEANGGVLLMAGPDSDLSDPSTAVAVIDVEDLAG